jgi:mRNA-degrading endonuclease toxin of MazEF toxin-antitoxin module
MVVLQAEVWWVELNGPIGPAHGYRRPFVVVQWSRLH